MATKRVCDRCGAEINPFNTVTYAGIRRVKKRYKRQRLRAVRFVSARIAEVVQ